MINIYKLMKSVKAGTLSFSPFNLRVKKAQGGDILDEIIRREEEEAQMRQRAKEIAEKNKVTPGRSVTTPSQPLPQQEQQIPDDVLYKMDEFISKYRSDMEELAFVKDPNRKVQIKSNPDFLKAEIGLYNAISKNPLYEDALVKKINDTTSIKDVNTAVDLVNTMKVKSKDIHTQFDNLTQKQIEEAEYQKMKAKREQERSMKFDELAADPEARQKAEEMGHEKYVEEAEKSLDKQKAQTGVSETPADPKDYSKAIEWEDPHLEWAFEVKYLKLTPEERSVVEDILGGKFTEIMNEQPNEIPVELVNASENKLGAPKGGSYIDQRMNFFLSYPEHMGNIKDDALLNAFSSDLPNMGVKVEVDNPDEIMNGVRTVLSDPNKESDTRVRILNILNNEKGQQLYDILRGLIDIAHPDIFSWLSAKANEKPRGLNIGLGKDDEGLSGGLAHQGKKDESIVMDAYEQYGASEVLANIGSAYITPMLEKAKGVFQGVIPSIVDDSIDKYKMLLSSPIPKQAKAQEDRLKAINREVTKYDFAEALQAFSIPMIDHVNELLSLKSKKKGDKSSLELIFAMYKNIKGEIAIPKNIVEDILRQEKGEEKISANDHAALAARYLKRMESGKVDKWIPAWNKMVSNSYMVQTFREMGDLKQMIRETYQPDRPGSREGFIGNLITHYEPALRKFSGVDPKDPESVKKEKMKNFIEMSLAQSDNSVKWLQEGGSRKGKELKIRAPHHQFKAFMQGHSYKLYGHLINKKEAAEPFIERAMADASYEPTPEEIQAVNEADNYTDESIRAVLELMGTHGDITNFLKEGRATNAQDKKHRSNTELYFELMNTEPPESIQTLMDIYNDGLSKSNAIDKETGSAALEPGSWSDKFFEQYSVFDRAYRRKNELQNTVKRYDSLVEENYQLHNKKLLNILDSPKSKPRNRGYLNKINKILDPEAKAKVNKIVEDWEETNRGKDVTDHLPNEIYDYFYGGFQKKIMKINKKKEPTERNLEEKTGELNAATSILNEMLTQSGYPEQNIEGLRTALRLVVAAYKRTLIKIAALEKMKKHNTKFSSVDSAGFLDMQIARVKTDFDHYFNSLFL